MKTLMESILQGYGSLVTVREGESARTFPGTGAAGDGKGLAGDKEGHRDAR